MNTEFKFKDNDLAWLPPNRMSKSPYFERVG